MGPTYDIVVLGATAAGYAGAYYLAQKGRSVVLLDTPHKACESPLADWVPKEFFKLPGLPPKLAEKCGAKPFDTVTYHNAALARTVDYHARGIAGYLLSSQALLAAMRSACEKAGVTIKQTRLAPAARLNEDNVAVRSPAALSGRFLILAQNAPGDAISDLSLPVQTLPDAPMVVAALDIPLGARAPKRAPGAIHVVETHDRSDLGLFFMHAGSLHVRIISSSQAAGSRVAELSGLLAGIQRAGLVPADLPLSKAHGAMWQPPAGVALELETHVAKRCLLAGTAGGFAESITGQTLLASVRSAVLAGDAVIAAAKADDPQESLIRFRSAWRGELANYLRPPNTSLQMLLPLLFVNHQIVAKFTKALLYGQAI
jgi:flavin-dependent dehydrogenase